MRAVVAIVRKLRWFLVACGFLLALLAFSAILDWRSEDDSFVSNLLVFFLVNLNVLALLVLIVMVGRNVVKLMFERKRGILGAKLRSRLMGAFVLIAFVPMVLSFLVASGLISEAMEDWFSPQIESAVTSSLTIARQYMSSAKVEVKAAAGRIRADLTRRGNLDSDSLGGMQEHLENLRQLNDLYSLKLLDKEGRVLIEASHPTALVDSFGEPPLDAEAIRGVVRGDEQLRIEERGAGQFIRQYSAVRSRILVASYRMDPEVVHAEGVVQDAFNEYEQLKSRKH